VVFGGSAPLVIEKVEDVGDRIVVRASTPMVAVACPDGGVATARVHGLHERTVGDVPLDARRVQVVVRVRRLVCPTFGCRRTFREQVPGVLHRYQRRTVRLQALVGAVARELAGRGEARLLSNLAVPLSRHSMVRALLRIPLAAPPVPRSQGVRLGFVKRTRSSLPLTAVPIFLNSGFRRPDILAVMVWAGTELPRIAWPL
jgi:hypothetical protein